MNPTIENQLLVHEVLSVGSEPVIDAGMPGTDGNRHGFEGGRTLFIDGVYHLFTAERAGDPFLVKMKLAHWRSSDGTQWERVSTLYESGGDFTGADPRAALWAPMPIFDAEENRWTIFYVAYRAKPNTPEAWFANYEGRIWRAVSVVPGRGGVSGPYRDAGVILEPDNASQPWEGLQGVDSFHAHRAADGLWMGFYGSAQTETVPCKFWGLGLATAPSLAGPWRRRPEGNPIKIDPLFAENPVVDRIGDLWIAMVDGGPRQCFGYSVSRDGGTWSAATWVDLKPHVKAWWQTMRTPLGLIAENDGTYSVFFTAIKPSGYGAVGRVRLALTPVR